MFGRTGCARTVQAETAHPDGCWSERVGILQIHVLRIRGSSEAVIRPRIPDHERGNVLVVQTAVAPRNPLLFVKLVINFHVELILWRTYYHRLAEVIDVPRQVRLGVRIENSLANRIDIPGGTILPCRGVRVQPWVASPGTFKTQLKGLKIC